MCICEFNVETIGNWYNCRIRLSEYENGSIKGELFSEQGILLYAFTEMGECIEDTPVLYARKNPYMDSILGKLMETEAIYGFAPTEKGAICAVNRRFIGQAPVKPSYAINQITKATATY